MGFVTLYADFTMRLLEGSVTVCEPTEFRSSFKSKCHEKCLEYLNTKDDGFAFGCATQGYLSSTALQHG